MNKEKSSGSSFAPEHFEMQFNGRKLIIEAGKLAQQANGSVTCQYGDTVILATATISHGIRDGIDYFPLMVDYQEKFYAAGKIKGSRFIKREGRPSDEAIVSGRVIDRIIRPLFPQHIANDVQIVVSTLCVDGENDSVIPSIIGAACALAISDIPFSKIPAACRVGVVNGELILSPTFEVRKKSELDLIVAATEEKVVMLEGEAKEVSEEKFLEAIMFAKKHIAPVIKLIKEIQKKIGKKKLDIPEPKKNAEMFKEIEKLASSKINEILFLEKKLDRKKEIYSLGDSIAEKLIEKYGEEEKKNIKNAFKEILENIVCENLLKGKRIGNRKINEIRPLETRVGLLPRTHGSGYFMRGETQVLSIATLASPSSEQIIEEMEEEYKKRFMHHYNFPPFSVGETGPLRGPSRRDIGHGALAEKALENLIPEKEKFPYTIRMVSEVLGSNGSSSMASVCAASLAMMDAGIPIKAQCAGIAMGLVSDDKGNYKILTDIQDLEDATGGMDFKVAGTAKGITACQMDTKTHGLTDEMVKEAIERAKLARTQILEKMNALISEPRKELSPYAPRIISLRIDPEKIREVIGPGGKVINEIIDATGVEIDIEDDGLVQITSVDEKAAQKALAWVKEIVKEVKVGENFTGKVTRITAFGVFVEIKPRLEGLIHISSLRAKRISNLNEAFSIGEVLVVKVIEIMSDGKVRLGFVSKK